MPKLEKVVEGLECCRAGRCSCCPYSGNVNKEYFMPCNRNLLIGDALKLLKEQERVNVDSCNVN